MDPFPTKGIEYLLILGYLAMFVPFTWLLSRIGRDSEDNETTEPARPEPRRTPWYALPDRLQWHRGHTWALPLEGDIVSVGMDALAHRLIGEPTGFTLPSLGQKLEQGEKGWRVMVHKEGVDLLSPVTGEVVGINEEALRLPSLAAADPYGQGWLMKVRVPNERIAVKNLLPARQANAVLDESSVELSALAGAELGPVLQDGGVPVPGFAQAVAGDGWTAVAARFFLTS